MSTQIVLEVPDDIYEQVERLAVATEREVAEVLLDTITRTFSPFPVDPNRSVMKRNVETFKALHAELVMTHLGQFVAICDDKLVDHDPDPVSLLQRIRNRYPGKVVLRRRVESVPEQVLRIRHTRIETTTSAASIHLNSSPLGHLGHLPQT